ncbi:MAG: glycosyltransferase family 39 protein, partial [bacterium]|nr:glycosyltransferase family 39 protein [bacterium]
MPPEKARFAGLDRWLLGVGALGVVVRLLYLLEGSADPSFAHPILDCYIHDGIARDLLAGRNPWPEAFSRAPFYPYLMAAVYYLTGVSLTAMRCLQAVIGGLTCIITVLLGRRVFNRRIGLAAGVVVALYGPMVFYDQRLLASSLVVCTYLGVLLLAVRAVQDRGHRNWLYCGVALGVAALVRPTIAPFLLVVLLGRLGVGVIRRGDRLRHLAAAGLFVAGIVLPVAPVTVRNYVKSGRFVPIAYLGGINLYIGNNPEAEHTIATRPGWGWKAMRRLPHAEGQVSTKAAQDYFVDRVREYVITEPGDFVAGLARKAALLGSAREIPRVLDPYVHRDYSAVLGVLYWRLGSFCFPFGVLAPLALLGISVTWRRHAIGLPLGYLAAGVAAVVLFFVTSRYRLPIVPVLALFAVSGVVWLRAQLADRRYRHLGAGLAVLLAAGVGVNWPQAAPSDRVSFASEFQSGLAQRLAWEGDPEAAERAQREAVALAPELAVRHAGLALLLLDTERMDEAIAEGSRP